MTTTHTHTLLTIDGQDEALRRRVPRPRTSTEFDDEIARLIRDRVQADLAKRTARRERQRADRETLERRRRYAKAALHAEKLAARAQQACRCTQPRPSALLARDPGGGTGVLTLCPVCGRRT